MPKNKKTTSKVSGSSVTPIGDKVLVRPDEKASERRTDGGIIVPGSQADERQERGRVIAVGRGRYDENGNRIPMEVSVGDHIIFVRGYDFQEIKINGIDHILVSANSVLAITS